WGPRAIGDHGAPVSLPKLKKAYEKESVRFVILIIAGTDKSVPLPPQLPLELITSSGVD
ncbi:unnamed protein product, partial [Staurois parvus]